jgi:hypothetical protein
MLNVFMMWSMTVRLTNILVFLFTITSHASILSPYMTSSK